MSTELKLRRGTAVQHNSFTGSNAEVTVDTTNKRIVVHDGVTAGGFPAVMEESLSNTITVKSVEELIKLDSLDGRSALVLNYRDGLDGGGGVFKYDASISKLSHDGENIIDPTRTYPLSWVITAQRDTWFTPTLSGTGCWVRNANCASSPLNRGDEFDQPTKFFENKDKVIFGEEYLIHVLGALRNSRETSVTLVHSGDSTTATAWGTPDPVLGGYPPNRLMTWFAESYGVRATQVNAGHSGESVVDWNNTRVAQDIVNNPNMNAYFARWGINDGYAHGSLVTFEKNLDEGLGKLRAFKGLADLSIILMSPNSTYDPANNRDYKWHEAINSIIRKLARKHKCMFFDTFSMFRDSKSGAGIYFDNPFGDGRSVHPFDEINASIYSKIAEILFKPIIGMRKNVNRLSNVKSDDLILSINVQSLTHFPYGISIYRAVDFPFDGMVIHTKTADNIMYQLNIGYTDNRTAYRTYNPETNTWSAFEIDHKAYDVLYNSESGYTSSAKCVVQGKSVVSQGFIEVNTASVINAGVAIATLSDTSIACSTDSVYFTATIWDGGLGWGSSLFRVNGIAAGASAGKVFAVTTTPFAVKRVYLNVPWSFN